MSAGPACVRACRLMQYAEQEKLTIAIDESVVEALSDPTRVTMTRGAVQLKGLSAAAKVYSIGMLEDMSISRVCAVNHWDVHLAVHCDLREKLRTTLISKRDLVSGTAVLLVPPKSGKKYLALTSIIESPMSPLVHVAMRDGSILDLFSTIADWFSHIECDNALRDMARLLLADVQRERLFPATQRAVQLLQHTIEKGHQTMIVIHRGQFIDEGTVRFIADACEAMFQCGSQKPGRLIFVICVTPLYQGCSASFINYILSQQPHASAHVAFDIPPCNGARDYASLSSLVSTYDVHPNDPTIPTVMLKSGWTVGLLHLVIKEIVSCTKTFLEKLKQGQATLDDAITVSLFNDGLAYVTERGCELVSNKTFRQIQPRVLDAAKQYVDVLPSHLQMFLKIVASCTTERHAISQHVVQCVAQALMPETTTDSLNQDFELLKRLLLLVDCDIDGVKSIQCPLPTVREVALELMAPRLRRLICKTAVKHIAAPTADDEAQGGQNKIRHHLHVALLEALAEDSRGCAKSVRQAWRLVVDEPDASNRRDLEHEVAVFVEHHASVVTPEQVAVDGKVPGRRAYRLPEIHVTPATPLQRLVRLASRGPLALASLGSYMTVLIVGKNATPSLKPYVGKVTVDDYMKHVFRFERLVRLGSVDDFGGYSEEKQARDRLWAEQLVADGPMSHEVAQSTSTYMEEVAATRRQRILEWSKRVVTLPFALPAPQTRSSQVDALCRAAEYVMELPEETDAAAMTIRRALVVLAVQNWTTSLPGLTVARLRDAWQRKLISDDEVRCIILQLVYEVSTIESPVQDA